MRISSEHRKRQGGLPVSSPRANRSFNLVWTCAREIGCSELSFGCATWSIVAAISTSTSDASLPSTSTSKNIPFKHTDPHLIGSIVRLLVTGTPTPLFPRDMSAASTPSTRRRFFLRGSEASSLRSRDSLRFQDRWLSNVDVGTASPLLVIRPSVSNSQLGTFPC
jgi:hypothetical protein